MNSSKRKKITWYFRKRLDALDYCNHTFEIKVRDEMQTIMDSVNSGKIQSNDSELYFDSELSKALTKLNYRIPSTFRNCMIVGVCTLIEDFLLLIGNNTIITNFEKKADNVKPTEEEKKEGGLSKIKRYLRVLQGELSIDFTPINKDLQLIDDFVTIRNSIVHAWGKIDSEKDNKRDKLRDIISQRKWVEETGDGYIFLKHEAYADSITPVQSLVNHILDSVPVSDD